MSQILLLCLVGFRAAYADEPARAQVLTSHIDVREVSPLATSPVETSIGVTVVSPKPWHLSVSISSADGEISSEISGRWTELISDIPHPVRSGPPAGAEGIQVRIPLRVRVGFDATPGKRTSTLALYLNGESVDTPIRIEYDVPAVVAIDPELRPLELTADHPAHHGAYDFEPQLFRVRSNTEWQVELADEAATPSSDSPKTDAWSLEVLAADGRYRPLREPVALAAGQATGNRGATVTLRVRVRLKPAAPAGEYTTDLRLRAWTGRDHAGAL